MKHMPSAPPTPPLQDVELVRSYPFSPLPALVPSSVKGFVEAARRVAGSSSAAGGGQGSKETGRGGEGGGAGSCFCSSLLSLPLCALLLIVLYDYMPSVDRLPVP